jgi:uncharacterized protein
MLYDETGTSVSVVATVDSLWRYPVKSMGGEEMNELFVGFGGVYGDRLFAFTSSASPEFFPFFTGRDQRRMIRYRPRFRHPEKAAQPVNSREITRQAPGINPISASSDELMLDVETPEGKTLPISSPDLIDDLCAGLDGKHRLTLLRSTNAITDCSPVSILSLQTATRIGEEAGCEVDKRRFRANIFLDLAHAGGFAEDEFVGKSLRIGGQVVLRVIQRDSRCMMITLHPDTGEKSPAILKAVAQNHGGMAGVYAAVLAQGVVRRGDTVELL